MKKKKKNNGRTVLFVLLAFVLIGIVLVAFLYFGIKNYNEAADPNNNTKIEFEIPKGSGTTKISNLLESAGLIKSAEVFKFKTKFVGLDGKYQAGIYYLSPDMKMEDIMATIQLGKMPEVTFTIVEGLTLSEVAEKFFIQGFVKSTDEFYKALEDDYDYDWLPETGIAVGKISAKGNRLEGYLYPETYRVPEGSSIHVIIDTMLKHFDEMITSDLKANIPSGYTLHDIVTLASIIEEECGADSDRKTIAGVFWNRLNLPMRLESDVTILYNLGNNEFSTKFDSPYNTYMNDGLPAGPICSPTIKSIEAAIYPESHDYYFFVLKGDGSHTCYFASTYEEHLYNVQKYRENGLLY